MIFGELTQELMPYYKFWVRVADYYDRQVSKGALVMYAEQTKRIDADRLVQAFRVYSENPKNVHMPRPAQLLAILEPKSDPEAEARQIANVVVSAVKTHGWPNSSKARADIGEIGWAAVEGLGGWVYVCENLGTKIDLTTFTAQVRGTAKALIEKQSHVQTIAPENRIEGGKSALKLVADLAMQKEMEK